MGTKRAFAKTLNKCILEAPRGSLQLPKALRGSQRLPEALRRVQRGSKRIPRAFRGSQGPLEAQRLTGSQGLSDQS